MNSREFDLTGCLVPFFRNFQRGRLRERHAKAKLEGGKLGAVIFEMKSSNSRGQLVAIGGSEDKEGECTILKEFVRIASRPHACIVVLTLASSISREVGATYTKIFKRLGADGVKGIAVLHREDVLTEAALKAVEDATAVFFTGGDQHLITSILGGTKMDRLLHERFDSGLIIAGTSAGATMMSSSMIVEGVSATNPRLGVVQMGPGLEFLHGAVVDTHFSQRGRHGRLLTAVAQYPHDIGIGIDEDTALIMKNQQFEVIGSGAVTIIDVGAVTFTNLPDLKKNDSLALYDAKVHVLPRGYKFDLTERKPVIASIPVAGPSDSPKTTKQSKSKKS